jgi:glycosyltransferase involved in cell wall biosynthesis
LRIYSEASILNIFTQKVSSMKSQTEVQVVYILTKLELGGAQKVCLTLLNGLIKHNIKTGLISGQEGVLVDQVKQINSVFLLKNLKREIGLKNFFSEFLVFFELIKKIKQLKRETPNIIVHTHSTKAGFLGRWAALFAGVKKRVHTVHGFGFHEHQNKISWTVHYLLEFFTSLITTRYICVSEFDQKIGNKFLPKFAKKSSVINAAVEYEKFYIPAKKIVASDKFVLGTISCFKPQKNLFDLLSAFKSLCNKNPDSKFLLQIIGDGILRKKIEQWILQNNMQSKIELLGWQNNVSDWLKKWDLFVLSSLWEGLPCAVVEARLSKLPVIAYNISGIPEVIFDNKNGFLVDVGNWQELANKIEILIKDKSLREKISNYQDNLNNFSNEQMIVNHMKLYKRLV